MNNRPKINAGKYTIYALLMLALYVLQSVPVLFEVSRVKPNLVIPVAVAIAVWEGEFIGGIFGAVAGLLCDFGGVGLFGFHGMLVMVCCVATGLLTIYLLRPTMVNYLLLLAVTLVVRGLLDYLLNFYMWGYADVERMLLRTILPGIAYTVFLSPLLYWPVHKIYAGFEGMVEP